MGVLPFARQRGPQPQQPLMGQETNPRFSFPSPPSTLSAQHSILVGREAELAQLQSVFEKALQGKRQVMFVAGEAGIGKTTLVDAFLAQIHNRIDVRITSGQCVEQYGPGEAYMPLLEATQRLCRGSGGERRLAALQRYAPSWLAQLPSLLEPQELEQLRQRVQGTNRDRMLREMAEAAELFTAQRGLVVVLEDLHWSDVSTLDWITYIARRREPAKLLILGTYRPTEILVNKHPLRGVVQDLAARRQCQELLVAPLGEEAISDYLRLRFGELTLPRAVTTTLTRRSGGNPLFVVNLVNDLVRQGAVTEAGGRWIARQEKVMEIAESVPDTVRQLIERQVERLSEVDQRLLEVASIAGVEFTSMDVAAGLSTTMEEIEASCDRFVRAGQWLRPAGLTEWPDGTISGRYTFLHAMYHEVIYTRVAEARRIQLHRQIAERKATVYGERVGEITAELAMHCERGRDLTRAVQYLGKAGETAIQRHAHSEAIAHLTKGLDLLATFPETPGRAQQELQLRLALVESLIATKGYGAPEVEHASARARELCQPGGEPDQLVLTLWGLTVFYLTRSELQTAQDLGEQLLSLAHHAQDPMLLPSGHLVLGQTLFHLGELVRAHAHMAQSTALYDDRRSHVGAIYSPRDPGVAALGYGAWVQWLLGYPEQARQRAQAALSLAYEPADSHELALALNYAAGLHYFRRERPAAQEQAEAAIQLATERELPFWAAMGTLVRGWALALQGRGEDGIAQMDQGLASWQALGAVVGQPSFLAMKAEAQGEAGRVEAGLRTLADAFALVARTGERYYEAELYRLKGELTLRLGAGDWRLGTSSSSPQALSLKLQVPSGVAEEAEECFLKAIEIARKQQAKSLELRAAMSLARLWQQQNKMDEAQELLQAAYNWFTEGFDTKDLQDAAALLTELGGEVRKAVGNQGNKVVSNQYSVANTEKAEGNWPKAILEAQSSTIKAQSPQPTLASRSLIPTPLPLTPSAQPLTPVPQSPTPNLFHYEGDYWTVSFAGVTCRLKDARGLHYVAHLLQHPHQEIHVLSLISRSTGLNEESTGDQLLRDPSLPVDHLEGFSDTGGILDPQARAAYKQRLNELQEEMAEAREFHDLGRSEQLADEIDFLTHQLASAVGLGGRMRRAASPAERARVNITRAVKIALRKITTHHPALGQHLAATLRTGAYCSYTPDTRLPITWQG